MEPSSSHLMPDRSNTASMLSGSRQVQMHLSSFDRRRIPKSGPYLVVANRLWAGIDESLLWDVFGQSAKYVRVLVPNVDYLPESLKKYALTLPLLSHLLKGKKSLKKALHKVRHVISEEGVLLLSLPFGSSRLGAEPLLWQRRKPLFRFLSKLSVPIVPVRLAWIHRRGWCPSSVLDAPVKVIIRIGTPIEPEQLQRLGNTRMFRRYLHARIFALGTGIEVKPLLQLPALGQRSDKAQPVAAAEPPEAIAKEITSLSFGHLLVAQGKYEVWIAEAREIPHALREIGRLRELTFRAVGEGTGKARDLDEYDLYYLQLIIWDRQARRIVGGYRMGPGDRIFADHGPSGFYISSLFKVKPGFWPIMRQAVELGRSYIIPQYQRQPLPLFLLWKGILHYLLRYPQYRYLYGPVSISKYFSHISRSLIVAYIRKYFYDESLAQYLVPRKPFRPQIGEIDLASLIGQLGPEIRSLDRLIEEIEPEHIRLPVLIRQYVKLNARFISFNVDPHFSNVLDGFILLDLQDVPYAMIEALKKETK